MIGIKLFNWLASSAPSTAPNSAPTIPALAPCTIKDGHDLPRRQPLSLQDSHFALLLHHHHPQRGNNVEGRDGD